ncbi:transferase [Hyphomicrobium sp.]|uniref:transferase n=1 Tax=Hyphomicrobium sp. TaxID=82 RepID=UPI002E37D6FE|nr:transferase [Hyphomicrobium sp.]HEX2842859.1 transferase [Hyphomicrobium sp.]
MASSLVIRTRAYSDELKKAASSIEQAAWSDLGYLSYTRAHYELYTDLLEQYPEYQLCLVDEETDYPVAVFNSVPLSWSGAEGLPQEGWDWVVETGARAKGSHTVLGGLAMSIPAVHRAKGYGRRMLQAMRELAESKGLGGVLAAVRPSSKARHPWVSIDDYITWTDDNGKAFDPWLRSHLASGGKLVGPCKRSMVVEEPIAFWETWSRKEYPESGSYVIDGALVPLMIDRERGIGRYEEPNIWVTYSC